MNTHDDRLRYVLVTAARNEEKLIERTIRSVISQTQRPRRWIIVSDGSTDRTDQIIGRYVEQHPWIELLRMPEHRDRSFAAKAACFNAGFERLRSLDFSLVGNLDADITFEPGYYEFILAMFAARPRLGVAGTPYVEDPLHPQRHSYAHRSADINHVSGACQMFRRECFDEVGGYTPIRGGGIDWVAVTTARMKGWETRTFVEMVCHHHRAMGTADSSPLKARFRHGREDYAMGGHPLWQLFRGAFQLKNQPVVIGGLALIAGYFWAMLSQTERPISNELVKFHRTEQMKRLRTMLLPWHGGKSDARPLRGSRELVSKINLWR